MKENESKLNFKIANKVLVKYTGHDKDIIIPQGVEIIGQNDSCFNYDIKSVVIPNTVKKIGKEAFSQCEIESIKIPDSVSSIRESAFYNCRNLKEALISDNVSFIGQWAFSACSLKKLNLPSNLKIIETGVFCNNKIEHITIPQNVEIIKDYAFSSNDITQIKIPDGVKEIGERAFEDCTNLKNVTISDSVEKIGILAFHNCNIENLEHRALTIKNSCALSQDGKTVLYCTNKNIKTLVIPDGVERIEENAFSYCEQLETVIVPESLSYVKNYAFQDCNIENLEAKAFSIKNSCALSKDHEVLYCTKNNIKTLVIPNGTLYISHSAFEKHKELESVVIPDGVKRIEYDAFADCEKLSEVKIADSVVSIDDNAFSGCNIDNLDSKILKIKNGCVLSQDAKQVISFSNKNKTSIVIPDGITKIGKRAFSCYFELQHVTIPESVTEIDDMAFDGCSSLEKITIPDSVKRIGEAAFSGCINLYSINIGNGLKEIGLAAFLHCEMLSNVIYNGSKDDWKKISKNYDNEALTNCEFTFEK